MHELSPFRICHRIWQKTCGQDFSYPWMMDKLVENPGGLHARITSNIYVRPFTLKETKEYLISQGMPLDEYQILQLYMILGGIPFYLSLLNPAESLLANKDRLFFRKNGELRTEFDELYNAIFSKSGKYLEIVDLLNKHKEGLTYSEMKFSTNPFVISDEYEQHVRERISLFRERTKTTKSLVSTFITTFGVANGIHRSIVGREIVAKDLFA